jgi:AraC family transcriptional regulator
MGLDTVAYRFCGPLHLLVAYDQGKCFSGERVVEDQRPLTLQNFIHKFTFVPAGHECSERHKPGTHTRLTFFYLDPALLPVDAPFAPRLMFEDLTLWHTTIKLNSLLQDVSSANWRYFEALGTVLVHELVRYTCVAPAAPRLLTGGLAGWQRRIVTTYIEERFAERIALATLAQLVRLSPYHFCRAFKQSFGMSPLRYQSLCRIEHAKRLLAKRELSVTDIGLDVGYGSLSSFDIAFRKMTGLSPSAYSRAL